MGSGKRVMVTRSPEQAGELMEALLAAGLEPILVPVLSFRQVDFQELDGALAQLKSFDWLVLTSVNAVKALAERRRVSGIELPETLQIAVVGPATSKAVAELLGRRVALASPMPVADSLAEALRPMAQRPIALDGTGAARRFLVVRAQEGREVIEQALRAAGAEVTVAAAYSTGAPLESLDLLREMVSSGEWPAVVTFASPSAVRNLLGMLEQVGGALPRGTLRVAIGPVTSAALDALGMRAHATASEPSPGAMVEAVLAALAAEPRPFGSDSTESTPA